MESTDPTADREVLRERVRGLLDASNRTQKQLETELGWSSGTVSRVLGGRKAIDADLLTAMAKALGTPAAELVAGTGYASLLGAGSAPAPAPEAPPVEPARPPPVAEALLSAPEPVAARTAEPAPVREPAPAVEVAPAPVAVEPAPEAAQAPEPVAAQPEPSAPPPAEPPPAEPPPEAKPGLVGRILRFFGRIRGR